jgi:hypothetical protein
VQETGILDERAKAAPGVVAAVSLRWITENAAELPRLLLPEHAGAAAEPSWERILVDAGLDRESRELSPAERVLADRLADARVRSALGEMPFPTGKTAGHSRSLAGR